MIVKIVKKIPPKKLIVILVLIGLALFAYIKFRKPSGQESIYQTAKAERGTIASTVSGSGAVTSTNSAQVATSVSGTVSRVYVKDGDEVKANQVIAEVDLDQESNQSYLQSLSSYQSAKNSLASAKITSQTLKSEMVAAQQDFIDQALYKGKDEDSPLYIQLNAEKKAAEKKYDNQANVIAQNETALSSSWYSLQQRSPVIYAPASGKITGFSLQEGSVLTSQKNSSNVAVSSRIANVITSASPMISIALTEVDIPKVKIGNKAKVILDAFAGKTFTGKVISIDTTGAVSSGVTTYPTVIQLDFQLTDIYPNMSASAGIIVDSKDNVLMIPISAVQNRDGQSVVRILKDGALEYVTVETGISSDTAIEIVSGMTEGQEAVTAVITPTAGNGTGSSASPFGIRPGGFGGGRFNR